MYTKIVRQHQNEEREQPRPDRDQPERSAPAETVLAVHGSRPL